MYVTGNDNDVLVQNPHEYGSYVYINGNNNYIRSDEKLSIEGITVYYKGNNNNINGWINVSEEDSQKYLTLVNDKSSFIDKNKYSGNFTLSLAQLQFNVENGIDVEESQNTINLILEKGAAKINGKSISSLDELNNIYTNYAKLFNENRTEVDLLSSQSETFNAAKNNFFKLFSDYITENADNLDIKNMHGNSNNLNQVKRMLDSFYGTSNDSNYRGKNLTAIVNTPELPVELRQAAATMLELNTQYLESSPTLKALAAQSELCADENVINYFKEKERLNIQSLENKIAQLEAKSSLTSEETVQLNQYKADLTKANANYEAYKIGDYMAVMQNNGLIEMSNNETPAQWNVPELGEPTYTTSVSIGDTTDATTYFTTNIFDLDTIYYASDLDAFADLYDTTEIETGDLNDSWLAYAISQLTEDQKMNAVSMNLQDGTVTVHLPGALGNRISTPRSYNFWKIAATTTLTNNGETINLSKGSLITKAIEMALIDNFGAEIFDKKFSLEESLTCLTGSKISKQSYYNVNESNIDRIVTFKRDYDDNEYILLNYDKETKTVSYANVNNLSDVKTESFSNFKNKIDSVNMLDADKTSYSQSAEASKYIAENTMSLIMSTVGDIPAVSEFMEQYSSIEEMAADAQNVQQTITTAMEDLSTAISTILESADSLSDLEIASQARAAITQLQTKYADTKAAPFLNDTFTSTIEQLTPDESGNFPTYTISSSIISPEKISSNESSSTLSLSLNASPGTRHVSANNTATNPIAPFLQGVKPTRWYDTALMTIDDKSKYLHDNGDGTVTVTDGKGRQSVINKSDFKYGIIQYGKKTEKDSSGNNILVDNYVETPYWEHTITLEDGSTKTLQIPVAIDGTGNNNYANDAAVMEAHMYLLKIAEGKTTNTDITGNDFGAKGLNIIHGSGEAYSTSVDQGNSITSMILNKLGLGKNLNYTSLEQVDLRTLIDSGAKITTGTTINAGSQQELFAWIDKKVDAYIHKGGHDETTAKNLAAAIKNELVIKELDSKDGCVFKIMAEDMNGNPVQLDWAGSHCYEVVGKTEDGKIIFRNPWDTTKQYVMNADKFMILTSEICTTNTPKTLLEKLSTALNTVTQTDIATKGIGALVGGLTGKYVGSKLIAFFVADLLKKGCTKVLIGKIFGFAIGGIAGLVISAVLPMIISWGIDKLTNGKGLWNSIKDLFNNVLNWDPLSFDLNNDGVKTTSETVDFDIDGDGKADKINNSADYVLVFDADGNGIAGENGREVFGDYTDIDGDGMADGYSNGFEALKAMALKYNLIGENDTKLDADDLKFLQEKVGLSFKNGYQGQTYTFEELGITEINLPSTDEVEKIVNFDGQDNILMTQKGATFIVDGEERTYADIWHKKLEE